MVGYPGWSPIFPSGIGRAICKVCHAIVISFPVSMEFNEDDLYFECGHGFDRKRNQFFTWQEVDNDDYEEGMDIGE